MTDFEGSRSEFLNLLAELGEQPAFIRRATAVEETTEHLNRQCRSVYESLTKWPRIHLANLTYRVGDNWSKCGEILTNPTDMDAFRDLATQWGSADARVTERHWTMRRAMREFINSAERFNRSWIYSLDQLNFDQANEARRKYNQYYPVEKECAFGGQLGSWKFETVDMLTRDSVLEQLPPLPTAQIR